MHYYPPAYPLSHPILAMVEAALQSVLPPESTLIRPSTPALNAKAPLNHRCRSYSFRFFCRTAALRQGDASYARLLGDLLVGLRVESAVGRQQLRRFTEALAVSLHALGQVRVLHTRLAEHLLATYDAAIHLVELDLAAELPRLSDLLAPGDDHGVLLQEAQNLLASRNLLLSEDAAHRLIDAPLD